MNRDIDGKPLNTDSTVVRMWHETSLQEKQGSGALAIAFRLSSEDKRIDPPYLSVFEKSRTTLNQAKIFTGKALALFLPVSDIRELCNPNYPDCRLDVCWYLKMIMVGDVVTIDESPGAEGHCGIIGLLRPPQFSKEQWKWFRIRLADIAFSNTPTIV